jgi:hypothetical protein
MIVPKLLALYFCILHSLAHGDAVAGASADFRPGSDPRKPFESISEASSKQSTKRIVTEWTKYGYRTFVELASTIPAFSGSRVV